jgi:hypothetical protein
MSWKFVFHCKKAYSILDDAAKKAWECRYKFILWNGDIHFILNEDGETEETGIKEEELF